MKKKIYKIRYDRSKVIDEITYIENELADALRALHNLKRSFFYPAPSTSLEPNTHKLLRKYVKVKRHR